MITITRNKGKYTAYNGSKKLKANDILTLLNGIKLFWNVDLKPYLFNPNLN